MGDAEADTSLSNLFHCLSTSRYRGSGGIDVRIPDTVSYQHGSLKWWFSYEKPRQERVDDKVVVKPGQVVRKDKRDCTPGRIEAQFCKGVRDGFPVATFLYKTASFVEEPNEVSPTMVEFLDGAGLRSFLHQRDNKPDGILQKFVVTGSSNTVTQVVWTPYVTKATRNQNVHKLTNMRVSLYDKCITHEGRSHFSREIICSSQIVEELSEVCRRISKHYQATEHRVVTRLVLFFKFNDQQLILLYPASIVSQRAYVHRGLPTQPTDSVEKRVMLNLNPVYRNGTDDQPTPLDSQRHYFLTPSGDYLSPNDFIFSAPLKDPLCPVINKYKSAEKDKLPLDGSLALGAKQAAPYPCMASGSRLVGTNPEVLNNSHLRFTRGGGGGVYRPPEMIRPSTAPVKKVGFESSAESVGFGESVRGGGCGVLRFKGEGEEEGTEPTTDPEPFLILCGEDAKERDDVLVADDTVPPLEYPVFSRSPTGSPTSPKSPKTGIALSVSHRQTHMDLIRMARQKFTEKKLPLEKPTTRRRRKKREERVKRGYWSQFTSRVRTRAEHIAKSHGHVIAALQESVYKCYSFDRCKGGGVKVIGFPKSLCEELLQVIDRKLSELGFEPATGALSHLCDDDQVTYVYVRRDAEGVDPPSNPQPPPSTYMINSAVSCFCDYVTHSKNTRTLTLLKDIHGYMVRSRSLFEGQPTSVPVVSPILNGAFDLAAYDTLLTSTQLRISELESALATSTTPLTMSFESL